MNAYKVVSDFERELAAYTGATYADTVDSCTNALFLALRWKWGQIGPLEGMPKPRVSIPKYTYVSVPMQIIHAGCEVVFRDEDWQGKYELQFLDKDVGGPIWDSARRFTSDMYVKNTFQCVSFHWSKILGIQQGGAILHDCAPAREWFQRARFDGRTIGVKPSYDAFQQLGWHMYMSPEIAAEGLVRLSFLPRWNADLPRDDYPDLSQIELFR